MRPRWARQFAVLGSTVIDTSVDNQQQAGAAKLRAVKAARGKIVSSHEAVQVGAGAGLAFSSAELACVAPIVCPYAIEVQTMR
jgi:hypothetical protein